MRVLILFVLCGWSIGYLSSAAAAARPLPSAKPGQFDLDAREFARIDELVRKAIEDRKLPGAVVVVVHRGHIVFRKAYGNAALQPRQRVMTPEIVFDLASLTKPIATAAAIALLVEKGRLRWEDPVEKHVPGKPFEGAPITLAHLLTHTSGLIADNALRDYGQGRKQALANVYRLRPNVPPGKRFVYSDVGYIVLGDIVERTSGQSLDAFVRKHFFEPLGMDETTFVPPSKLRKRCAPTQEQDGKWLQGEVHDPRAARMEGVAGHAGLFSTADDLAVFAQMLLNEGEYGGRRVLQRATVRDMLAPRSVPGTMGLGLRTYGWDMDTAYSSNRGTLFPAGKSFGHTGFTGTSLWVDPTRASAVIFLSNRVHPDGKGNVVRLRGEVATAAARALKIR